MSSDDNFLARRDERSALTRYDRAQSGIRLRNDATLAERRIADEWHRHSLMLQVERTIAMLGGMTTSDLILFVNRLGVEMIQDLQDTMNEAEATLNPEYLSMFKAFSRQVVGQGANDMVNLRALANENVMDIVAQSVTYLSLPPEKQSWIVRLIRQLQGR